MCDCDQVKVEVKYSDELYAILTDWKNNTGNKKLVFIYDPADNGWRYRIILFLNNTITYVLHGELEPDKTSSNSPLTLLKNIIKQPDIESYYSEYISDTWPLTGNEVSTDNLPLENIQNANINKVISDFAKKRSNILKKHEKDRPTIPTDVKNFIYSRSMGCCEFTGCAIPLFKQEGRYGNFSELAHIIGAGDNGPRSEQLVSTDEKTDPNNFLVLCKKHHILIDRVDMEFYDKHKLRKMISLREKQREILASQLKNKEANSLIIISDIAGVPTGISDDEVINAMLASGLQPINEAVNIKYLADQNNGHELLSTNAEIYWADFLNRCRQDIYELKNFLNRDSGQQAARYRRLAIFPLGNIPTMFLAGYITAESRAITLFHRDRNREGGTWCWDESPTKTNFSWGPPNTAIDECSSNIVMLSLEITANLREELIPENIRKLPRISIKADNPSQNPFGSIADFHKFRDTLQEAINFVQDTLRAKEIHIICIAPVTTVFALGQKFQRRNAAKLHIYQTAIDKPYYPVFSFCQNTISMTSNPNIKIEL